MQADHSISSEATIKCHINMKIGTDHVKKYTEVQATDGGGGELLIRKDECTLMWSIVVIGKSSIPEGHIKDYKHKIKKKGQIKMQQILSFRITMAWKTTVQILFGLYMGSVLERRWRALLWRCNLCHLTYFDSIMLNAKMMRQYMNTVIDKSQQDSANPFLRCIPTRADPRNF